MFAAAHDQENLAHIHQTAAAAKPLNQGNRGAKTPAKKGPKTPFRVPLNDENAPLKTGKSILKANGGNLDGAANDGKQAKDGGSEAFVTPAGMQQQYHDHLHFSMSTEQAAYRTKESRSLGNENHERQDKSFSNARPADNRPRQGKLDSQVPQSTHAKTKSQSSPSKVGQC